MLMSVLRLCFCIFSVATSVSAGQLEVGDQVVTATKTVHRELLHYPDIPSDLAEFAHNCVVQKKQENASELLELLAEKATACRDAKNKAGYHLRKAIVLCLVQPSDLQSAKRELSTAEALSKSVEIYTWLAFCELGNPKQFERYLDQSIVLGARDGWTLGHKSAIDFERRHYTDAFRNAELALRSRPENIDIRQTVISVLAITGRIHEAVIQSRELLKIAPHLSGGYRPLTSDVAGNTSIEQGRLQIQKLLGEVPSMAFTGKDSSEFYDWYARMLSGVSSGIPSECRLISPIEYHSLVPDAAFISIESGRKAMILLNKDTIGKSWCHDWAVLTYELFNIEIAGKFNEITEKARVGSITSDQFVEEMVKAEHETDLKVRAFFVTDLYDLLVSNNVPCHTDYWMLQAETTAEQCLRRYQNTKYIKGYYDTYRKLHVPR